MSRRFDPSLKRPASAPSAPARGSQRWVAFGKRARISGPGLRGPYSPPENWYEPEEDWQGDYSVVVQSAGRGFRHVLTEEDVRARLAQLPAWMLAELQVVQLSTMTRKKRRSPCYGMQWGNTIYLYPIEDTRVETFLEPPKPAQKIEAAMFGAQWRPLANRWQLLWTEEAIRDFYLNNVLVHELGHILDHRNTRHIDRERYAEWFALEHGVKASRRAALVEQAVARYTVKRHHRS